MRKNKDRNEHVVRGGVYYEAGFAFGVGLPIIWSVRSDCLDALHFDTRQYPHIVWRTPQELRTQLQDRIEALLGQGPDSSHVSLRYASSNCVDTGACQPWMKDCVVRGRPARMLAR